jgi:uncharacterized protein (TIGR03067 family)
MGRTLLLLVALTGLLRVSGPAPAEDKKDPGKLEGKWEPVSQTVDGKESDEDELKNRFAVFKGGKLAFLFKGKERGTAAVKLDPGKSPKQIDITYEDGPAKGTTLKGIYKVEGDKLTICFGGFGKSRPAEFASKPGSGTILIVQKRAK